MNVPHSLRARLQGTHLLEALQNAKPDELVRVSIHVNLHDDDNIVNESDAASRRETNTARVKDTLDWIEDRYPLSMSQQGSAILKTYVACQAHAAIPASVAIEKLQSWFDSQAISNAHDDVDLDRSIAGMFKS